MIDELTNYAKSINASYEIIEWLSTTGKKSLNKKTAKASDIEHIIDYFNSGAAPKRLRKMSIKDAKRKAKEWTETNKKKGRNLVDGPDDIETFHEFEDGSKIVRLKSKKAFQREGFFMAHCLGGYSPDNDCYIYSLRDKKMSLTQHLKSEKTHKRLCKSKVRAEAVNVF